MTYSAWILPDPRSYLCLEEEEPWTCRASAQVTSILLTQALLPTPVNTQKIRMCGLRPTIVVPSTSSTDAADGSGTT
eukprot:COSAG06_NODE_124_length_22969_cov_136.895310_18_plen_77_part_00